MSVTPIELQTNFAQKANVDKIRQGALIHEQAEKAHISDVADEITRDNLNVVKPSPSEAENKISDKEKNEKENKKNDNSNDESENNDEFNDLEDENKNTFSHNSNKFKKIELDDPNKGKIVDIKL
jgi:hypothetical protein